MRCVAVLSGLVGRRGGHAGGHSSDDDSKDLHGGDFGSRIDDNFGGENGVIALSMLRKFALVYI